MRRLLVAAVLQVSGLLVAQTVDRGVVGMADGGSREVLESIAVPPLPKAPFSLTLATSWARPFGRDGGTYTLVNERHIMRDSAGRIRQERWWLVPKNGTATSQMTVIQIMDPAVHTRLNCFVMEKRCEMDGYSGAVGTHYVPRLGSMTTPEGSQRSESLGGDQMLGLDVVGMRETTLLNVWTRGNDQPMVTTREFWWSQRLGISLLSVLDDAMVGRQEFRVTAISTAEPAAETFAVPDGYKVVDVRALTEAPGREVRPPAIEAKPARGRTGSARH